MTEENMYHKLPVSAYTSQEWFDKEQELIFSNTWRYACFREDITEPGQYLSLKVGKNNIFIVMGKDKRLRAFHNICRHRGTQLIRAVGKAKKALTCPYHDWTYDLEGNLISVPDEETEYKNNPIDKSCLGLKPASVDIWQNMVFVHPDPDAGSIMEWFGDCERLMGPHKPEELPEVKDFRVSYEIKANWKIVVENYIDIYHLSHLHSHTLHMFDHANAEFEFVGPHYMFKEPLSPFFMENVEDNVRTPLIIPKEDAAAWVPMFFPGIGIAHGPNNWATFIITPLAPNLSRVENRLRRADASKWDYYEQAAKSYEFWKEHVSGKYGPEEAQGDDDPMASGDFTMEDIYACEQQQVAFESPHFEVGPAAEGEAPILGHQQAILDFMAGKKEIVALPERQTTAGKKAAPAKKKKAASKPKPKPSAANITKSETKPKTRRKRKKKETEAA